MVYLLIWFLNIVPIGQGELFFVQEFQRGISLLSASSVPLELQDVLFGLGFASSFTEPSWDRICPVTLHLLQNAIVRIISWLGFSSPTICQHWVRILANPLMRQGRVSIASNLSKTILPHSGWLVKNRTGVRYLGKLGIILNQRGRCITIHFYV